MGLFLERDEGDVAASLKLATNFLQVCLQILLCRLDLGLGLIKS